MKKLFMVVAVFSSLIGPVYAQTKEAAARHAKIGLAAAAEFPGFASLCNLEARIRNVNASSEDKARVKPSRPEGQRINRNPERAERAPLPPMQVFDNLYFLGNRSVTAWLYGTPKGYLLIDGLNTDEEAQSYILGGMKKLGLDPDKIEAVLVTHGHGDHYGGADYIAEQLGVDILMSGVDWDFVSTIGDHPRFGPPPERGIDVSDGDTITAGGTSLQAHLTPGHTPGTLSLILDVFDNGVPHTAMLWGGTGFNFGLYPEIFLQYARSASKMREISEGADVDVILSNHVRRDRADILMEELASRKAGEPHPFVSGEGGRMLFTVLEECALAQAERLTLPE